MQPSSARLALVGAGANLILCVALGVVLMITTRGSDPSPVNASGPDVALSTTQTPPGPPTTTPTRPRTARSTTPTSPGVPAGYQRVNGPGGMTTVVPQGWPSEPSTGPGNIQATDPADANRLLKYGGSAAPAEDIYSSHVTYESQVAKRPGYQLTRLDQLTFHGTAAIDWEFEWTPPEGRRHVRSLYWRQGGYEYFVYAAAPDGKWSETQTMLNAMIDNATP